jgi:hypothetical protein
VVGGGARGGADDTRGEGGGCRHYVERRISTSGDVGGTQELN